MGYMYVGTDEGTHPRDELAEHDPVREYVGAVVVPAAAEALRRHPPRGPDAGQPIAVALGEEKIRLYLCI